MRKTFIILKHLTSWVLCIISPLALAAEPSTVTSLTTYITNTLSETWQSQTYEWYIPINTWHNRDSYTRQEINEFNERPWGIGAGKYRYDQDGDWHGIYAMAFLDSQSEVEPIVGYGFQKVWQPHADVKLGLGYTVGVTLREDSNYVPIPVLLPLLSVKYKSVALQSTYIPGGQGHGNVLFTWLRWEMNE